MTGRRDRNLCEGERDESHSTRRGQLLLHRFIEPDTFPPLTLPFMIYNTGTGGYPVARSGRWLLVGWSLFLLGGFAVAYALDPDPRGFGTHTRLGLPPCTFRALCGIPCPSCGMTTSFSHFVHGNVLQAIRANVGGVLLAVVCAAQIPWCWWSAARGRLVRVSDPARSLVWLLIAIGSVCLVNWVLRLIPG